MIVGSCKYCRTNLLDDTLPCNQCQKNLSKASSLSSHIWPIIPLLFLSLSIAMFSWQFFILKPGFFKDAKPLGMLLVVFECIW